MEFHLSKKLFKEANQYLVGGVNSPVRAFKAVSGQPVFIERGAGAKIYDVDGNEYIDYVCSWGPLILGHAHPQVVEVVKSVCEKGTSFGAGCEVEVELARQIIEAIPSIELIRLVNSGTEAVMSAIRLARAWTKRDKIIKFEGCYHGHSDSLLVKAGSGATTLGIPDSLGIPTALAKYTITLPYNDLERVKEVVEKQGEEIACIIVEPIAANMGLILPGKGFLQGLREITRQYRILLIFDEVITGFRVAYGGAQQLYGVQPDITCLGKIIGGGFPVGAYGGKREIMEMVAPLGDVYQAGTLSGNPIAMHAGLQTLKILAQPTIYEQLAQKTTLLVEGLQNTAQNCRINPFFTKVASLFCIFFTREEVIDYQTAKTSDTARYATYFKEILNQGIYLAPSQFEAGFVSLAHTQQDIEKTISASRDGFKAINNYGMVHSCLKACG
ncbi:MAG: glutamate-1-semialdehyde 2,1-aminomutase [bacterium]|nr:glutamate-1-semialdehyde 2,1-aminomutase [bacterium]